MDNNNNNNTHIKSVDQLYAEGYPAKLWNKYTMTRPDIQKEFLLEKLRSHNVRTVLDVACGTGLDSMLLVEEGFQVVSTDFSDKMLAYALEERWNRRNEPNFNNWVIKEANWMTLAEDLEGVNIPEGGFDAVICIGSSLPHVPEPNCDQSNTKLALRNIASFVKPGGLLIVDHRNFDELLRTGKLPDSINYPFRKEFDVKMTCKVLHTDDGRPKLVVSDYRLDIDKLGQEERKILRIHRDVKNFQFNMTLFPHKVHDFQTMLRDVCSSNAIIETFGNFQPFGQVPIPAYYQHVIQMPSA